MSTQDQVWLLALALMLAICGLFLFVYLRSQERINDYPPLQTTAYRWRTRLFALMVVTMIPAALYMLVDLPYVEASAPADHVVEVKALQWGWEISQNEFSKGETVLFRVQSADVNHGFGLYDESFRLVAQTQAMPGVTNVLRHTFDEPGRYQVLCMEYCGLGHHNMLSEITVAD